MLFRSDEAGVTFIGPPASAMRAMGEKVRARDAMKAAGVPVVPGSDGALATVQDALKVADEVGYPVMLKAAAGGGGKGIRLVFSAAELPAAFEGAQREAGAYFASATVYLEKAIVNPRHIEIQVMADGRGHCIHLFDRECSVQRRNQKIIEESPAANLSDATRLKMGAMAVRAAEAVNYAGAGTIECLVDAHENFWFMEMNTRLQVEHPVTELVTGVDLVHEQLRVALGHGLSVRQADVRQRGHAIEVRVYAEDPARNFLPSPGPLRVYRPPVGPGLRLDDGFGEGDVIPRFYDPMIAKLSAWAPDRSACIARMAAALRDFEIGGIQHNIGHLLQVLASEAFVAGRYDTGLVKTLAPLPTEPDEDAVARFHHAVLPHRRGRALEDARDRPGPGHQAPRTLATQRAGSAISCGRGRFAGAAHTSLNPSIPTRSTTERTKRSPEEYCSTFAANPETRWKARSSPPTRRRRSSVRRNPSTSAILPRAASFIAYDACPSRSDMSPCIRWNRSCCSSLMSSTASDGPGCTRPARTSSIARRTCAARWPGSRSIEAR